MEDKKLINIHNPFWLVKALLKGTHSIRPKSLQNLTFMVGYKKDVRVFATIS